MNTTKPTYLSGGIEDNVSSIIEEDEKRREHEKKLRAIDKKYSIKCPRYTESEQCQNGSAQNKTCLHCDHNAAGFTPAPPQPEPIKNKPVLEKNDKIRAAMDNILNLFESDNLEIITRAVFEAPPGSELPSDKWSFMNRIFMMIAGTDDARGYRQWQDAGRQVKKDTSAFYIFGPMIKKFKDKVTEEEQTALIGFKPIPVFRYEDTEGAEIVRPPKPEIHIPYDFHGIIQELSLKISTAFFHGDYYGYYSPSTKEICLCTPEIKTFLHELSHAVDTHLGAEKKRGGQEPDREVVAEFSAAVIASMMGYKIPLGNSKQYIKGYGFKELLHQLNRCEKVIQFVIERTRTAETAEIEQISAGEISGAPAPVAMEA